MTLLRNARDAIAAGLATLRAGARPDTVSLIGEAPAMPRDQVPCIGHSGPRCAPCHGTGYETAPTDLPGWMSRARRCNRVASLTSLTPDDAAHAREQEAHAWAAASYLSVGPAKTLPMRSAVLAFNLAGKPDEARLLVMANVGAADAYTLTQIGEVGRDLLHRRAAMARISRERRMGARLAPTAHGLGDE